jgi:flavin-binding protein dodecin
MGSAAASGAARTTGEPMTVARITEISSVSKKSFEDAILQGIARAHQTLRNVAGAWVKDQEVQIKDGKPTGFKVILKITFVLSDESAVEATPPKRRK